jgi:hydrogenase-4 component E
MNYLINLIIVAYIVSLIYLAKVELLKTYVKILALQGFIIFFVAIAELKDADILHLAFVLVETLLFKAIFVPLFMQRLIKRAGKTKNSGMYVKPYASVVLATIFVAVSFAIVESIHDSHLQIKYFTAAISSIIIGLYVGINHRDIITHLVCYMIIENGIFLIALALGGEMPILVNSAILLDIFSSILIMGIFLNKIKDYFHTTDENELTQLKD